MTTPMPEVRSYVLRPTSTTPGYLDRADTPGLQSVTLREGVNSVQVSWMGDSEITVNHRNINNLTTTLPVRIPAADGTRRNSVLVFTVPVPPGTNGELLFIRATEPTSRDVERVTCGVTIISNPTNQ